jgi:hypothetical protein
MQGRGRGFLLAVATWAVLVVSVAGRAAVPEEAAEGLMHKSGLWEAIGDASAEVTKGMEDSAGSEFAEMPQEARDRLHERIAHEFAVDRLRASVRASVAEALEPKAVADVGAWYDTPLGQSVLKLQRAVRDQEGNPDDQMAKGRMILTAATPERQASIRRIAAASRLAESMANFFLGPAKGMTEGMMGAMPSAQAATAVAEMRAEAKEQADRMVKSLQEVLPASIAYAYEKLSDQELSAYGDFLEGDSGTAYTLAELHAMEKAMSEAAKGVGRGFIEDLDKLKTDR